MIPDEAVEAALKIYNPSISGATSDWEQHHQRRMRAALEAALPYLSSAARQPQRNSPSDWPDVPRLP